MKCTINKLLLAVFAIGLLMSSCKTSNDVVSSNLIQKRKYNKGYHVNKAPKSKDSRKALYSEIQQNKAGENKGNLLTEFVTSDVKKTKKNATKTENELLASTGKSNVKTAKSVQEIPAKKVDNRFLTGPVVKWPVLPFAKRAEKTDRSKSAGGDMSIMAILSFVFGLVGLITIFLTLIGVLLCIAAIIFAAIGWNDGDIFAILGLVFGAVGVLLFLILLIWALIFVSTVI